MKTQQGIRRPSVWGYWSQHFFTRYAAEQGGLSPEERALFAEHATIEPDAFEPADMLTDELDELRRLQVPGAWEEIEEE